MIQIALCDDDRKTLDYLEKKIVWYAKEKTVDLYINKFDRAKELKAQLEQKKDYQVYLLDILMPDIDGISLGKVIREQNERAVIIYLTSSADYVGYLHSDIY